MKVLPSGKPIFISNRESISTKDFENAPVAAFDAGHGQPNWAQTGFPSRELHTNFAGLTEILCRQGFHCQTTGAQPLEKHLLRCRLLVIPTPTGQYDVQRERWRSLPTSKFSDREIHLILEFIANGGRLLAFGYRFGDSFTRTNLHDLFIPLGCQPNDDVVIDARMFRDAHPLQIHFDTPSESIPPAWAREGIARVRWRPMATFTLQPGAAVHPIALSTGGHSICFDRRLRQISLTPMPIAVAGCRGAGQFALFGGPHVFESGPLGLLGTADNTRFLRNVITWLVNEPSSEPVSELVATTSPAHSDGWTRVENWGDGARTITSVERVLRRSGISKALSRARWMP